MKEPAKSERYLGHMNTHIYTLAELDILSTLQIWQQRSYGIRISLGNSLIASHRKERFSNGLMKFRFWKIRFSSCFQQKTNLILYLIKSIICIFCFFVTIFSSSLISKSSWFPFNSLSVSFIEIETETFLTFVVLEKLASENWLLTEIIFYL